MKNLLLLVSPFIFMSCVPVSKHEDLKTSLDSLESEYLALKHQCLNLEMEYNKLEPLVLLKEGRDFVNSWKWFEASQKLNLLVNKYPETKEAIEASILIEKVNNEISKRFQSDVKAGPKPTKSLAFGNISDWKSATYDERIRICRGFTEEYNKRSSIKITSIDLYNCIETATVGLDATNSIPIQTMVILCMDEILKEN